MALTVHTPDPSDEIENTHRAQAKNKIYVCCPTPVSPSARSPASNHSERNCHDKARARHTCQEEKACRGRVAGQGSLAGGGGHEKKGVRRVANQRARVCQHAGRRGPAIAEPAIAGPHVTPGLARYLYRSPSCRGTVLDDAAAHMEGWCLRQRLLRKARSPFCCLRQRRPPPLFSFLSPR